MSRPSHDVRADGDDRARDWDAAAFGELSRPTPCPDQTRAIMGRLGFMRSSPSVVRRRLIRLLIRRLTMCAAAVVLVGTAVYVHQLGPDARAPSGLTIPAAIVRDVNSHQQRLKTTAATIRNLIPQAPSSGAAEDVEGLIDEDVDRSAIGPVRWL